MYSPPSWVFLSTPSARRATEYTKEEVQAHIISIHALREEGDGQRLYHVGVFREISIHALREEGDRTAARKFPYFFISIHALREEGDFNRRASDERVSISIHALREEGD